MLLENLTIGLTVCLVALIAASINDIKTREVPDWLSYALMCFAIGYSIILSVYHMTWGFFINSVAGFLLGLALGLVMFYTGQWGGGDSKLIMGVCAIFGLSIPGISEIHGNHEVLIFLFNTIIVGAIYGIAYSSWKLVTNMESCREEARKKMSTKHIGYARIGLMLILAAALAYYLIAQSREAIVVFGISALTATMFYAWIFLSCVEKICMIKEIDASALTEGDWLAEPVTKKGKNIATPNKTGLSLDDIAKIRKSGIKKVVVKEGIPFVPSFLIAYILTLILQNWVSNLA